jgi:phosphate-selective porin OprO and OprP
MKPGRMVRGRDPHHSDVAVSPGRQGAGVPFLGWTLVATCWIAVRAAAQGVETLPAPEAIPPPSVSAAAQPFSATFTETDFVAVRDGAPLQAIWQDGLRLASPTGDFAFALGGRVQADASGFTAGPGPSLPPASGGLNPPLSGAANFRRARLRAGGRLYEFYDWATEYDFANQMTDYNMAFPTLAGPGTLPAMKDMWLQVRDLPLLGTLRIGNQKDPYGLEHISDSRWLTFMERSFSMDAFEGPFNDGYLPGIQIFDHAQDGRVAWYLGEFKNTANPFGFANSSGGSQTVGRLVVLPLFDADDGRVVHLGLSGRTMGLAEVPSQIDPVTGNPTGPMIPAVRFRSRGDIRNGPPGPLNSIYADAGLLTGDWQNMLGLELAAATGPLSLQAEYFGSWLYGAETTGIDPINSGLQPPPGTPLGTVFFQGAYLEAAWFLTGEHQSYDLSLSRFGRPVPRSNFYRVRDPMAGSRRATSPGAWQMAVRYNYLCLDDGEVHGGVLNGLTLGLNWLLNPHARIYFNYDFTYRDFVSASGGDGSGGINGFGTRMAFDF